MRISLIVLSLTLLTLVGIFFYTQKKSVETILDQGEEFITVNQKESINPLTIESLRKGQYEGSDLVIEETLALGSNYSHFLASYISEGHKIFGLLTVPSGDKPSNGWPVMIFNHGYIPPKEYSNTEKYVAYTDAFSRNGYIVFKSDYRGHGDSEGEALGGYGSNAYTIDVLNALASIKKFEDADPEKIGMWGHSMGGFITLRSMVVSKDIKAGVIWAGVVGSYPDLLYNWRRSNFTPPPLPSGARRWREVLIEQYGTPEQNPKFWNSLSANTYLSDISGPVQLHHGTADASVPIQFSKKLEEQLKSVGKEVEIFTYEGDDHNLAGNLGIALNRSVEFFDRYLKTSPD